MTEARVSFVMLSLRVPVFWVSSSLTQSWRRRLSLGLPAAETLQSQWKVSWLFTLYKLGYSTCSIYRQTFEAPLISESDCSCLTGGPDGRKVKSLWQCYCCFSTSEEKLNEQGSNAARVGGSIFSRVWLNVVSHLWMSSPWTPLRTDCPKVSVYQDHKDWVLGERSRRQWDAAMRITLQTNNWNKHVKPSRKQRWFDITWSICVWKYLTEACMSVHST